MEKIIFVSILKLENFIHSETEGDFLLLLQLLKIFGEFFLYNLILFHAHQMQLKFCLPAVTFVC